MSQKKILEGNAYPNELELQELEKNTNQNQFAPYVNIKYCQNYVQENYNEQNYQKNENEGEKENKFLNFKQYLSNISDHFKQESVGCQFLTVCNGIICLIIVGIIIKSL